VTPAGALHACVGAFVDELARSGVGDVVVCPGSRSTPLALVLADHPGVRVWMHYDERSAAFFALGMARFRRQPVGVLCTSGTAAANFMPAVVEASYGRVPLLVLTADRPPELQEVGAPQTVDQLRLYGRHAKWFAQALLPEATDDALRYARTLACRAAAVARAAPAGPVHVNLPFREPLIPLPGEPPPERDQLAWHGRPGGQPYVRVTEVAALGAATSLLHSQPDEPADGRSSNGSSPAGSAAAPAPGSRPIGGEAGPVERLARELAAVERGLLVCGPQDDPRLGPAAHALAAALGWPLLADPLSGARTGPAIDAYDALLRDADFVARAAPEAVLRLGAMPTSKPVLLYLQRHGGARQVVVDAPGGWQEPTALAAEVVHADPPSLCRALAAALPAFTPSAGGWLTGWRQANARARAAIAAVLAEVDEPFEGRVFAELADLLPAGATLWAGSSMPVRDLDTFFPAVTGPLRLLANRGANGIDGVVSSALGAAAAADGPLVLAIGDLSFYHDMNGLLAARLHALDATVVLLNNDGGGIFSFLPQAAHPRHFERLFGTPHGLDFRPAVEMYGGRYERVTAWPAFRDAVRAALEAPGLKVIELPTDRARNVELHRLVWPAVSAALAGRVAAPAGSRTG
jgi:2-succinyl-5-enolpyruvyl-6-hydroxy-3-cyclohexene-1-carboxylate synthase